MVLVPPYRDDGRGGALVGGAEQPQVGFKQKDATAYVLDLTKVGNTFVWYRLEICIIAFADLTKPNALLEAGARL